MDLGTYARFVGALFFVLALIGAAAWLARRYGVGGRTARAGGGRRLAVIETATIDARNRLVLVRRDGCEHLLLLGAGGAVVVESAIPRLAPSPEPTP